MSTPGWQKLWVFVVVFWSHYIFVATRYLLHMYGLSPKTVLSKRSSCAPHLGNWIVMPSEAWTLMLPDQKSNVIDWQSKACCVTCGRSVQVIRRVPGANCPRRRRGKRRWARQIAAWPQSADVLDLLAWLIWRHLRGFNSKTKCTLLNNLTCIQSTSGRSYYCGYRRSPKQRREAMTPGASQDSFSLLGATLVGCIARDKMLVCFTIMMLMLWLMSSLSVGQQHPGHTVSPVLWTWCISYDQWLCIYILYVHCPLVYNYRYF